jgi:hypothetical protein
LRFKLSLAYLAILLVTSPLHLGFEQWLVGLTGRVFIEHMLLAVFLSLMLVALVRGLKHESVAPVMSSLLAGGLVIYWNFNLRIFAHKLHVVEFFLAGILIGKENRQRKSVWPFLILLAGALGLEFVEKYLPGRVFDAHVIWVNIISGLAGFALGL